MTKYIVFTNSSKWYLKRLLKNKFQHCYVLINDGFNWIKVNSNSKMMSVEILREHPNTPVHRILAKNNAVLEVDVNYYHIKEKIRFGFFSCVNMVCFHLGIGLRVVTPYGLYMQLRRCAKKEFSAYRIKFI